MAGFRWTLLDAQGRDMRDTEVFDTREAAEDWMGASWSDLLAEGAERVRLSGPNGKIYEMGLREA